MGGQLGQGWGGANAPAEDDWNNGPRPRQRKPTGPPMPLVAAPLFNLPPLIPEAPPQRPTRNGARGSAGLPPAYAPDPTEIDIDPAMDRGWRVVSPALPPGAIQPGARPNRQRRPPPPPQPGIPH